MRLWGSRGAARAAGARQVGWDPAPPPAQLSRPVFVVPQEAPPRRAPAPPYWPAVSRARNQLGPAGLRAERWPGLAAAGRTEAASGSRPQRGRPPRRWERGRVPATPLFYTLV